MSEAVRIAGAPAIVSDPAFPSVCDWLYDEVDDHWELYPTTAPALIDLRKWCDNHGCRLGVVCNMDERLPRILKSLGISDKFDFVISSYACGFEQPSPEIYYAALDIADVPRSALASSASPVALHCGNSAMDDLHGALGAGFAALLVDKRFPSLQPLQMMITEWQPTDVSATRAWHAPHLGLASGLLET